MIQLRSMAEGSHTTLYTNVFTSVTVSGISETPSNFDAMRILQIIISSVGITANFTVVLVFVNHKLLRVKIPNMFIINQVSSFYIIVWVFFAPSLRKRSIATAIAITASHWNCRKIMFSVLSTGGPTVLYGIGHSLFHRGRRDPLAQPRRYVQTCSTWTSPYRDPSRHVQTIHYCVSSGIGSLGVSIFKLTECLREV